MTTKEKKTLTAQIKKATSYIENGDPIEASEVLDMAKKTCTDDAIRKTLCQTQDEVDHGTLERAEHLIDCAKYHLNQIVPV